MKIVENSKEGVTITFGALGCLGLLAFIAVALGSFVGILVATARWIVG